MLQILFGFILSVQSLQYGCRVIGNLQTCWTQWNATTWLRLGPAKSTKRYNRYQCTITIRCFMEAPSAVKQTSAIYCYVPSLQLLGSSSKRSEKAFVGPRAVSLCIWDMIRGARGAQKAKKSQKEFQKDLKGIQEASLQTDGNSIC